MSEFDWQLFSKIVWLIYIVGWGIIRYQPNRRARKIKVEKTSRTLKERFSMGISFTGLGILPASWVIGDLFKTFDYTANPVIIVIGAILIMGALKIGRAHV